MYSEDRDTDSGECLCEVKTEIQTVGSVCVKIKKGTDSGNVSVKYPVAGVCLISAVCEAPGQKELNECFIKVKTKTCRQCFIKKFYTRT